MKLCVNIDHVATLREARGGNEPDPVYAGILCELAGADGITFHLRTDRRHIKERDIRLLKELIHIKLNMEMANTNEMIKLAKKFMPDQVTLVPEKRQELTTEGGLDVKKNKNKIRETVTELQNKNIDVSLFVDPINEQIDSAFYTKARCIELHTGRYANAFGGQSLDKEFNNLKNAAIYAKKLGLTIYAGHGLGYSNIKKILDIPYLEEVNIGHSIVSRAVFSGITNAVREMKSLI